MKLVANQFFRLLSSAFHLLSSSCKIRFTPVLSVFMLSRAEVVEWIHEIHAIGAQIRAGLKIKRTQKRLI